MVGVAAAVGLMEQAGTLSFGYAMVLALCAFPSFLSGLAEDMTKRVSVLARLLMTMVAASLAFFLLDARLVKLSLPGVDSLLTFVPISLAVTMIAVAGISHAMNIIDGFNGLSGVVSLMILLSLAFISHMVGDPMLMQLLLAIAGGIAGFLLWNFPRGQLFLGDGGAYFIGFVIAESSVLLVKNHPEVSPWFPMLLVVYPVWETIFSAYRRKVVSGVSSGTADALHLHSLIYRRLLRGTGAWRNARTSPYLWSLNTFAFVPALLFWRETPVLMASALAFILIYLWLYRSIVRFRTPCWLAVKKTDQRSVRAIKPEADKYSPLKKGL
jgi:UDP-N-acetylmuramyl pentapeptide phosphotransferase/UDP-N-acetylglucosamine-1-phosphate transferase